MTYYVDKFTGLRESDILIKDSEARTSIDSINTSITSINGSITDINGSLSDVDDNLTSINDKLSNYITPQDFGALGDGVTDDTVAFEQAIADAKSKGIKIAIPSGTYNLSHYFFEDESLIEYNNGTFSDKPIVISKEARPSSFTSYITDTIKISHLNTGDKWLNGGCYDSKRDRVVLGFNDNTTTSYLTAVTPNFKTVLANNTITGSHHLNTLTYNDDTDKIIASGDGVGEILVFDPATLSIISTYTIQEITSAVRTVTYDPVNKLYFIASSDYTYVCDTSYNVLKTFETNWLDLAEFINAPLASIVRQHGVFINGQYFELLHSGDNNYDSSLPNTRNAEKFWLVQLDYDTGEYKSAYSMKSAVGYDELECGYMYNNELYLLSCEGINNIYVFKANVDTVYVGNTLTQPNININADEDLNDYTTQGKYSTINWSTAQSLSHCPTDQAFTMYVIPNARGQYIEQIIIDVTGRIYLRAYRADNDTWVEVGKANYIHSIVTGNNGLKCVIYDDKRFEISGRVNVTLSGSTSIGSLYYSNRVAVDLPIASSLISSYSGNASAGKLCWPTNISIETNQVKCYVLRAISPNGENVDIDFHINGTLSAFPA